MASLDNNGAESTPLAGGGNLALCIPRGAIHRFDNNCGQEAKALCVITTAAIGPPYFRESAEVINAAAGGPPDPCDLILTFFTWGLSVAVVVAVTFSFGSATFFPMLLRFCS